MIRLFIKDPIKKLESKYADILTKAVSAQRNGNIALYSRLSFEANEILKRIDELREKEDLRKS